MTRHRSSTIAGAVDAAQAATQRLPESPLPLTEAERPFWGALARSFTLDEFSPGQRLLAATLAREMSRGEVLHAKLAGIADPTDPHHRLLDACIKRQMSLTRLLKLQPKGDPRDLNRQRRLERQAREIAEEIRDEGDLLA